MTCTNIEYIAFLKRILPFGTASKYITKDIGSLARNSTWYREAKLKNKNYQPITPAIETIIDKAQDCFARMLDWGMSAHLIIPVKADYSETLVIRGQKYTFEDFTGLTGEMTWAATFKVQQCRPSQARLYANAFLIAIDGNDGINVAKGLIIDGNAMRIKILENMFIYTASQAVIQNTTMDLMTIDTKVLVSQWIDSNGGKIYDPLIKKV